MSLICGLFGYSRGEKRFHQSNWDRCNAEESCKCIAFFQMVKISDLIDQTISSHLRLKFGQKTVQ